MTAITQAERELAHEPHKSPHGVDSAHCRMCEWYVIPAVARILAEHTERAVREALEAAAVRVEAEVASEIERLGGKEVVSANGMLNNWVGGIATAARVLRSRP